MRSVQFGLCSVRLFSLFFFFYQYFPLQTLTIYRIAEKGEEIFFFYFHPLTNIHLVQRDAIKSELLTLTFQSDIVRT